MAARRIKGSPMKYWGFYCNDDLKADTIKCAEIMDISDSEYIRKAVENYNKKFPKEDSTHKNNTGIDVKCNICGETYYKENEEDTVYHDRVNCKNMLAHKNNTVSKETKQENVEFAREEMAKVNKRNRASMCTSFEKGMGKK